MRWRGNVGYKNISVDLMYGLPQQTTEKYLDTVNRIVRLKPDHISAYSLIVEKGHHSMKSTNSIW